MATNKIQQFEEAIKERYGEATTQRPGSEWTAEHEKEHSDSECKFYQKIYKNKRGSEKVDYNGFLKPGNLIKKTENRVCSMCNSFSFDFRDDIYQIKFKCCRKCYIKHYEGREEKCQK